MDISGLLNDFRKGSIKALARCISLVENEVMGYEQLLQQLPQAKSIPIVGITGPPGAGKSSLVNLLASKISSRGNTAAIIAVDPSSPFNFGSLLGDRIRMAELFQNEQIYIRSMASRGSLGGLTAKIVEVTEVVKAFGFDYLFIETVGVGQSEVEISGLADTTVVVLVPEAGDEVQTLKSGLMEIADIFVVNKADRDGAQNFVINLQRLVHDKPNGNWQIPVIATSATSGLGLNELLNVIERHNKIDHTYERKLKLLAERVFILIQNQRMKDIDKDTLEKELKLVMNKPGFNLFKFAEEYS